MHVGSMHMLVGAVIAEDTGHAQTWGWRWLAASSLRSPCYPVPQAVPRTPLRCNCEHAPPNVYSHEGLAVTDGVIVIELLGVPVMEPELEGESDEVGDGLMVNVADSLLVTEALMDAELDSVMLSVGVDVALGEEVPDGVGDGDSDRVEDGMAEGDGDDDDDAE